MPGKRGGPFHNHRRRTPLFCSDPRHVTARDRSSSGRSGSRLATLPVAEAEPRRSEFVFYLFRHTLKRALPDDPHTKEEIAARLTVTVSLSGSSTVIPIYGVIAPRQNVAAGIYQDIIVVGIVY
jgi:hypothetical protein